MPNAGEDAEHKMKMCTSSRHTARHCHLVTTASTSLTAVTAATSTCYIFILPSRDILAFCGSCVNINNFAAAHCSCHGVWSVAVSGVTQLPGQVPSWAPGRFWPSHHPRPVMSQGPALVTTARCPHSTCPSVPAPNNNNTFQTFNKPQVTGQCGGGVPHWVWGREQIKLSARRFMSQVPQQMYGLAVLNLNWIRAQIEREWARTGLGPAKTGQKIWTWNN